MARTKKTIPKFNDNEVALLVSGQVSDLKASGIADERDLSEEFLGKSTQEKIIDKFEESQGIKRPAAKEIKPKYYWKNIILELDKDTDRQLFNQMMNDPKYRIMEHQSNFTPTGKFKMFIMYGEKIDSANPPDAAGKPIPIPITQTIS